MKIGIHSGAYLTRYGLEDGLRRMRSHGYEALDYQFFVDTTGPLFQLDEAGFEKELLRQRKLIEDNGIEISQTHGPWRWPPRDYTPEDRAERFEKMAKSIRGTALLGCRNLVIHPIMPFGCGEESEQQRADMMDRNREFMGRLIEIGRQCQVIVNFENMPMPQLAIAPVSATLQFVKEMNSPWFKVCLDTGHAATTGESPAACVRLLGKEFLQTLHIHDNNGKNDFHWIPYTGVIDWQDFSDALAEIGFDGTASLETAVPAKIPTELRELQEISLFQMIHKIARRDGSQQQRE
ncbi:MAG: sugar phosphate isomerase/epimerase [Victivallales bacterium]|nr:sugar phosphate isomerase/epimerase [Victivallales bacterium]